MKYVPEKQLYQYDQGVYIIVPDEYRNCTAQFYSKSFPDGLAMENEIIDGKILCQIPNQMLVNAESIIVYAFRTGTNIMITESLSKFSVTARPKPPDFVLDPTDTVTYKTASELITDMQTAKSEEAKRVTAESLRASAETERASSETVRKSSEAERVKAESERAVAETARSTAETARANSEQSREVAETNRVNAEVLRANAETSRSKAESSRVTAEQSRANAESERASAEQNRANAEGLRAEAESSRQAAEQLRAEAEEERAGIYEGFNSKFDSLKSDLINVKADVSTKASQTDLDRTNLYLDALFKLNKGQTWDTIEAETEAYSVDVPSGAKYASVDKVGGKSVVWNQLWNYEKTEKEAGITFTYENHFYDVVKNTTENNGMYIFHSFKPNNKYYVSFEASSNDNIKLSLSFGNSLTVELTESNKRYRDIITTNNSRSVIYLYSPSSIACSYRVGNIKVINLTQMFGAGNEPTFNEFEAMFPADYYEYCEPTIISSQNDRIDISRTDGTQQITTNFPALNSAGSVYDYIDLNEGKLHQRVGVVDLATWSSITISTTSGYTLVNGISPKALSDTENSISTIGVCGYRTIGNSIGNYRWSGGAQLAVNTGASTEEDARKFFEERNSLVYYELAEEIITDITIPTELTDWLAVEAGGSITFRNTDEGKRLLIPNKLSFIRKLDEVTV